MKLMGLPDQVAAEEVALQQRVVHQRHEQQQRSERAGQERHKLGHVAQYWRRELLDVLLRCLVTGIQPAQNID